MTSSAVPQPAPIDTSAPAKTTTRQHRRPTPKWPRLFLHVFIFIVCAIWFTPILQLIAMALRTTPDTGTSGWWHIFTSPLITLDNFSSAGSALDLVHTVPGTLAVVLPAVVLTVLFSAMGGYAIGRWNFRGRLVAYGILLAMLAVPPQLSFTPLIKIFSAVGLSGTPIAVWIFQVGYTLPFGIFLVRGYLLLLPRELFEAASIDGAGETRIFLRIVLPLTAPILVSLAILQFTWSWNDLLTPLIFVGVAGDAAPITLTLAGLASQTSAGATNVLAAGSLIAVLPPLVILIVLQRYFVAGITAGAVK